MIRKITNTLMLVALCALAIVPPSTPDNHEPDHTEFYPGLIIDRSDVVDLRPFALTLPTANLDR